MKDLFLRALNDATLSAEAFRVLAYFLYNFKNRKVDSEDMLFSPSLEMTAENMSEAKIRKSLNELKKKGYIDYSEVGDDIFVEVRLEIKVANKKKAATVLSVNDMLSKLVSNLNYHDITELGCGKFTKNDRMAFYFKAEQLSVEMRYLQEILKKFNAHITTIWYRDDRCTVYTNLSKKLYGLIEKGQSEEEIQQAIDILN